MLAARRGGRGRRTAPARGSPACGTASRRRAAGRSTATSATRACSCSTRARPACSPTGGARWSTTTSGTGSSTTRAARSTTWSSRARCRSSCRDGIHHLEAWNEALCDGRWGRVAAGLSERLRRAVDLEHWAAFNDSFERLCDWLRQVARGAGGVAPASIRAAARRRRAQQLRQRSRPWLRAARRACFQLVCSPFRNPLSHEGTADGASHRLPRGGADLRNARPAGRGWTVRAPRGSRCGALRSRMRSRSLCSTARTRVSSCGAARGKAKILSALWPRLQCRSRAIHPRERATSRARIVASLTASRGVAQPG